ncbi:hypothetical protein EVAR_2342_1 [Eumeta japonica]|uniref:Uncharacterized protein n=1 Tax=Eumeta variegata TaxID=151549 RepID=A0A4C1SG29_EUMVA|nr:hypothetical protein EVAR_2342_1 [Eumeta japonica]
MHHFIRSDRNLIRTWEYLDRVRRSSEQALSYETRSSCCTALTSEVDEYSNGAENSFNRIRYRIKSKFVIRSALHDLDASTLLARGLKASQRLRLLNKHSTAVSSLRRRCRSAGAGSRRRRFYVVRSRHSRRTSKKFKKPFGYVFLTSLYGAV